MSRIYRARDLDNRPIENLPIDSRNVSAPATARARGGVQWIESEGGTRTRHRTQFELRQAEAEQVLARAQSESERIQREAYHQGFAQGEAAGRKLAAQKIEPVLKALATLIASIGEEREKVVERYEGELIRLAYLIATKVLHREIETNQEAAVHVARAALAKVVKARHVTLMVSPYDLEMMQQHLSDGDLRGHWTPENVTLEADFSIGRGGCRITTDSGEIDATIETQLHLLKTLLWNE